MDQVTKQRRDLAITWSVIAAAVALAAVTASPRVVLATWLLVLAVLVVTSRRNHAEREERLERPRIYRAIAGAVVAVALAGCALGVAPSASEASSLALPFFAGTAFLGYRAAVARGPRPALLLAVLVSFGWMWGVVVFLASHCKCDRHDDHWTSIASRAAFLVELVLISVLVAVTMIAFRRRTDALPDARVVR